MASEINSLFDASAALTITLADGSTGLASSSTFVGRGSVIVDNTAAGTKYQVLHIYVKVTTGTTPTANTNINVYFLSADVGSSPNFTSDSLSWTGTDAAYTPINAILLGTIVCNSATSNLAYTGKFTVRDPGPGWGIGIGHNTGVNLNVTAANHFVRYVGQNPEAQ
jgi:hypothetical protein